MAENANLGVEVCDIFKNLLTYTFINQPHGGAITAHFTFWPITLDLVSKNQNSFFAGFLGS